MVSFIYHSFSLRFILSVLTACLFSCRLSAQCSLLCNTDFENQQVTSSVAIVDASQVPCWNTTAPDNKIEVWYTGFNGVPSYSGNQFIELNAYYVSTLYQNFTTSAGSILAVSFAHRGRAGIDTMSVSIGPVGGPYITLGKFGDGNTAWGYYTVYYTIPSGQGTNFSLRFNSIYATGGNQAIGNFLDAISATVSNTFSLSLTSTNVSCGSTNNGSASVTNCSACTYTWLPSGGNSSTASSLSAGTYTVQTFSNSTCLNTATVTISSAPTPNYSLTTQNISCYGLADGSAGILNCSTCSYTWSPGTSTTNSLTGLGTGNYSVTVNTGGGCVQTSTFAISQPQAIVSSVSASSVTCNGLSNGSATLTASGGTSPLSYSWAPGGYTSPVVPGLSAGIYSATVTDAHGCSQTHTVSIAQPPAITASAVSSSAICGTNGSATVTATGGSGALTYTWSPSGGNNAIAGSLPAGNYTVVVADANHCSISQTLTVQQLSTYTVSISSNSVSCHGYSDGSASVTTTGGQAPFSYTWLHNGSNVGSSDTISSLQAGTYVVNIQDASNCINTQTVIISQPPAITVAVNAVQVCNGQQAVLTPTVSGGVSPYSYLWLPSSATSSSYSVTPASGATYTLQVADGNHCLAAPAFFTVTVLPTLSVSVNGNSVTCSGGTVALSANGSGGNGNYQYTWQPGNLTGSGIQPVVTANTVYTVTVSDGCTTGNASATFAVDTISSPVLHIQSTSLSGCAPLCVHFYDSTLINTSSTMTWHWLFSNGQASNFSTPNICFTQPGAYTGSVNVLFGSGCQSAVALISGITVFPSPDASFTSSNDKPSVLSPDIELTNTSTNYNQVIWTVNTHTFTGDHVSYSASDEPQYDVVLIVGNNYGCVDSVSKIFTVKPDFTFYAPNTFTPNGDIRNDIFLPVGIGWKNDTYQLTVFDRWGSIIYKTNDYSKGWNGRFKNNDPVKDDLYVWQVELDDIFSKHHSYTGSVLVLR